MKTTLALLIGLALLLLGPLHAGEGAAKDLQALIRAAQAAARKKDPAATRAAYAKVLTSSDATPAQKSAAHLDIARVLAAKNKVDEALAEYDRAAAVEGLTPSQTAKALRAKADFHFRRNFKGAYASYFDKGIRQAEGIYKELANQPDLPNGDRIAAYKSWADCRLEQMDVDGANELLATAAALPGVTPAEQNQARLNQAIVFQRQLAYERARAAFETLRQVPDLTRQQKQECTKRLRTLLNELGETEAAKALAADQPGAALARADLKMRSQGGAEEALTLYRQVLTDEKQSLQNRTHALLGVLEGLATRGETEAFMATADQYIPAFIAEREGSWHLYNRLDHWRFTRHGLEHSIAYQQWLHRHKLRMPTANVAARLKSYQKLLAIAAKESDWAEVKRLSMAILSEKDLPAKEAVICRIKIAVLEAQDNPKGIVAAVRSACGADAEPKALVEAFLTGARFAMAAQQYRVARALDRARSDLLVPVTRRSIACPFLPDGPRDISEFMASAHFKEKKNRGAIDRKYGDNLQILLDTDAALTGRSVTKQGDNAFTPAEFVTICDADGIRFFFFVTTDKAEDFADGLMNLGGYEIYIAAGKNVPYHCYLIDMPPGKMNDNFVTQYNNTHFRRARQAEGTARIEHRAYPHGVATLLTLSWTAFFNRIPTTGDAWEMDVLSWAQGGHSWGGSKSVHNRSSFGDVVFQNMTAENRNAIKRRIVATAAKAYRKELSAHHGCVEIWKDPELGDQAFYAESVQPFEEKYSAYLGKVGPEMTAEEVELVYREAAVTWMNTPYAIAALRKDYLDRKRLAGD